MAKVPEDVKAKIKGLAEKTDTPIDELQKRFGEIMKTDPVIAALDSDMETKMRVAAGTLIRENVSTGGEGNNFYLRVVSKSAVRIVGKDRKRVGDCYAIAQELDEDGNYIENSDGEVDTHYAAITLWEDSSEQLKDLEGGKCYKANLMKTSKPWGVQLSTNEEQFKPIDDDKTELPTVEEFYDDEIKPMDIKIDIAHADLNVSDLNNPTDIRELEGTVIRPRKGVDKNGKEYAVYGIIDGESAEEFTVWTTPDMMKYGVGSDCKFIGNIMKGKDGKISMNAHFVIPARPHSVTPLRLDIKPVGDGPKEASIPASVPEERNEDDEHKTDSEPEF